MDRRITWNITFSLKLGLAQGDVFWEGGLVFFLVDGGIVVVASFVPLCHVQTELPP